METVAQGWMWGAFVVFVIAMLVLDMFALGGNKPGKVSVKEAAAWSLGWFTLAMVFNALLWWYLDGSVGREVANTKAMEFFTGYLIEKSLSVDNLFVFLMLFGFFAVPAEYQRRVLLYGVLGAIVLRAIMVLAGVWLVSQFSWMLYLFGAFLVVTGIKMVLFAEHKPDLENNPVLKWMRSHLRMTNEYSGEHFTVVKDGLRYFTPLFAVLVMVEISDVIFAVDSIPAIFAVTTDPFIVFTSNIFAILGLRALYFLLADMADRFHLLKYGVAVVLLFVGIKLLIADFYHVPVLLSLAFVALILTLSVIASLIVTRTKEVKV
ncbi:MAG TPA: TerC family protein [Methylophilaceae bacterium]|nr:TerC family protein [Methylophilaceae bacterium]